MDFTERINQLPTATGAGSGSGLLVPLFKGFNHLATLITHDVACNGVTPTVRRTEFEEALNHLRSATLPEWTTPEIRAHLNTLTTLATETLNTLPDWDEETMTRNATLLTARLPALLAQFDNELTGFEISPTPAAAGTDL